MNEGISFIRDLTIILISATACGWIGRRLGLSPVVGYLAAGLVIGTPEITFIYVTDPDRVQVLAQLGLVFLMFAIGLGIRLRQLRELGLAPIIATTLAALLMLTLVRGVAPVMGLDPTQGLFFASMLMVSSSAIIGKVLAERRMLHQRSGQLALTQTLLEDFVAIILLTVLGSIAAFEHVEGGGGVSLISSLGQLAGFVLLCVLTGLVVLPRLLSKAQERGGDELQIVLTAGLLFGLALVSVLSGYSLALGAFLFGVLVAETPRSRFVERTFAGMRDVFTAVFFTAIGMSIDLRLTPQALDLILIGTVLAIVGRVLCSVTAWFVACERGPNALKTALAVTPVGEFSFIIAGLGVASGLLSERFQIAAVGISFLTSLITPMLVRAGDGLAARLPKPGPRLSARLDTYRGVWSQAGSLGDRHLLWRLLRKRVLQIIRELAWTTAVLVFAQPVHRAITASTADQAPAWLQALMPWFWVGIVALILPALVALIRNIQATAMIVADYASQKSALVARFSQPTSLALQIIGLTLLTLLLLNLLPWAFFDPWIVMALILIAALIMFFGWRRLIRMQSEAEMRFQEVWQSPQADTPDWSSTGRGWGFVLEECVIPEHVSFAGKSVGQLGVRSRTGASIVGIQRHGIHLNQPGPTSHLFPDDRVFLLGRPEQVRQAIAMLTAEPSEAEEDSPALHWENAILEAVRVPAGSPLAGRRLDALHWSRLFGVQVAAVRTAAEEAHVPGGNWVLREGTEILLAGNPASIREIRQQLSPAPPASAATTPASEDPPVTDL